MKPLFLLTFMGISLLTIGCMNKNVEMEFIRKTPKWEKEKEQILEELSSIKENFKDQIKEIDKRILIEKHEGNSELIKEKKDLETKLVDLMVKINELENTIAQNWEDFKEEVIHWKDQLIDS